MYHAPKRQTSAQAKKTKALERVRVCVEIHGKAGTGHGNLTVAVSGAIHAGCSNQEIMEAGLPGYTHVATILIQQRNTHT